MMKLVGSIAMFGILFIWAGMTRLSSIHSAKSSRQTYGAFLIGAIGIVVGLGLLGLAAWFFWR